MAFQVTHDTNHFRKDLEKFLEGVMDLFRESRGFAFSARKAGGIVIKMMVLDQEVDAFGRVCGEAGETAFSNYYYAKAVAFGMAGRVGEGHQYLDKARTRRTGGVFAEMCQTYYGHS